MSTDTRRLTTDAAPDPFWRAKSACKDIDLDTLFSDKPLEQARVQTTICRSCPVLLTCLQDAVDYEAADYAWGIAGGLTHQQRRALRVEATLGNVPDLEQARVLASPMFAGFMHTWRDWPAETVTAELRSIGVFTSPVTVRVALWWSGGKGSLLPPRQEGDHRSTWMQVRDECQEVVARLRDAGVTRVDIAAYLGVAHTQVELATRSWNKVAARAAKGAKTA
jgi:hypothetical protein